MPSSLPSAKEIENHSNNPEFKQSAFVLFVGSASTILEWEGIRLMTGPNFIHVGDHVHLGPGVSGTRKQNLALEFDELPKIDAVLLSNYHGDHFDQDVEAQLRRSLPINTTPHAKSHLAHKEDGEASTDVYELDAWKSKMIYIKSSGQGQAENVPAIKFIGMPGKHVAGTLELINGFVK